MIVPKDWLQDKNLFESNFMERGSKSYKTESGLKVMNQTKRDYPCYLQDLERYNQSLVEVDIVENDLGVKDSDGGETMEEDEFDDNPLFKRHRKDKTLKCTKCGRGGHPEASCLASAIKTQWCHVCQQSVDSKHDILECPMQDISCQSCGMVGHLKPVCFTQAHQKQLLQLDAWNLRSKLDISTFDGSWSHQNVGNTWNDPNEPFDANRY